MVDSFLRKLKDVIVGPENENPSSSEDEDNYDRPSDSGPFGNVRPASEDQGVRDLTGQFRQFGGGACGEGSDDRLSVLGLGNRDGPLIQVNITPA